MYFNSFEMTLQPKEERQRVVEQKDLNLGGIKVIGMSTECEAVYI